MIRHSRADQNTLENPWLDNFAIYLSIANVVNQPVGLKSVALPLRDAATTTSGEYRMTEAKGSHAIYVSQPKAVAKVIESAAKGARTTSQDLTHSHAAEGTAAPERAGG